MREREAGDQAWERKGPSHHKEARRPSLALWLAFSVSSEAAGGLRPSDISLTH